jgi:hypothetical protein
MGLSLPCRGQGGQYSRLPAESKEKTLRRPMAFFRKALSTHGRTSHQHHSGWLCCIASSSARDAERKRAMEAHQAANIEIPEQSGRARSSRDQVQNRTHARIQTLRLCCHHHCRSRITASYSERSIRPRILTPQRPSCARYLERCPSCVDQSFSKTSFYPLKLFAPEPFGHPSLNTPDIVSPYYKCTGRCCQECRSRRPGCPLDAAISGDT